MAAGTPGVRRALDGRGTGVVFIWTSFLARDVPTKDTVLESLDLWRAEGLLDDALHARLVERAEADAGERRRRQAARFVTATGAVLLVAAFVVLTTIFWEDMTPLLRAVFLWAVTLVVLTLGVLRMAGAPTDRLGTALVAVAMPLSLGSAALTRGWQPDPVHHPAVVIALVSSAFLIGFFGLLYARRNPVLPALGLGVAFVYVPVAAALLEISDMDAVIVVVFTAAMSVLVLVTTLLLASSGTGLGLAPGTFDGLFWVAFAAMFVVVPALWFEVIDPFDGLDDWGPILTFAALAAWTVLLGIRTSHNGILILGSLMVIVDAWYFGIAKGEAIGTFLALFASALVLFWLGHRLGLVRRMRGAAPGASSGDKGGRGG